MRIINWRYMLKVLKNIKIREMLMIGLATILICCEIYFDLKIPECINQITVLASSQTQNIDGIIQIGINMLLYLFASLILTIIVSYLSARAASGFTYTLREKLFNKVLRFSDKEVNKFSLPSLITRTTNDVNQVQILISMGLQTIVKSPIMAIWAISKILDKNWQLSLLTSCFIIAVCIGVFTVMILVLPKFRWIQKYTDSINTIVRENIKGINVVYAFNAQNYQNEKFEKVNKNITFTQLFIQRVFSGLIPLIELSTTGLWFSIYWLGAALLIPMDVAARIEFFGNIIAFAMYASYVLASFMMMTFIFMMYPPAKASGERIVKVLESDISIKDINKSNNPLEIDNNVAVEFKNVSFKYEDDANYVLKNLNFTIDKGQTLAIIGPTGSGKSTLANLIMRFYEASKGKIKIFNNDILNINNDDLYNTVYMATQKPVIFYGTVKENILFGKTDSKISNDQIKKAIEISQSSEFVNSLKNGINTTISQEGKDLSGGQKQRLSIARAIIRNPKIIILDDSFSALDYKTDAKLRKDLKTKMPDTTKILIAQRVGTIKNADKIIVLDKGQIVGYGTHDQLIKDCDIYKKIAESQTKMSSDI